MAHRKIVEVVSNPEYLFYLSESDLYEDFAAYEAIYLIDNVQEDPEGEERAADFAAFVEGLGAQVEQTDADDPSGGSRQTWAFTVTEGVRANYFRDKYIRMQKLAADISFDEFCTDSGLALYNLRLAIRNTVEDDIVSYNGVIMSLDTFMRHVPLETKMYIGNVLDAHY